MIVGIMKVEMLRLANTVVLYTVYSIQYYSIIIKSFIISFITCQNMLTALLWKNGNKFEQNVLKKVDKIFMN